MRQVQEESLVEVEVEVEVWSRSSPEAHRTELSQLLEASVAMGLGSVAELGQTGLMESYQ
jgi:hypothetical protein